MRMKLPAKWVSITDDTKNILNAMKKALETQVHLQEQRREIDSEVQQARGGFVGKIASWREFFGGYHGAQVYQLPAVNKQMDSPAGKLCKAYHRFIYDRLKAYGRGSGDTEKDLINSSHVVICEILLRFAVVALSRDENTIRDSTALIDALDAFCNFILENKYLTKSDILGEERLDAFGKSFATRHGIWLKMIRDGAKVINTIHSNKRAIANTSEYLEEIDTQIMRLIVALAKPNDFKAQDLSDNWIEDTFECCETLCLTSSKKPGKKENLSIVQWGSTTARQDDIIVSTPRSEQARIRALYKLRNDNQLMMAVADQLDLLMNQTGWVLILLGVFKPSHLSQLIFEHHKKCTEVLTLDPDDPVLNLPIATGLAKYHATSTHHLDVLAAESYTTLAELDNPDVIQGMVEIIGSSLHTLLGMQENLKCNFIDKGVLEKIAPTLLPAPPEQLALEEGKEKEGTQLLGAFTRFKHSVHS